MMKKLISLNDIKDAVSSGKNKIYTDEDTIITPSARDDAREKGIEIIRGIEPGQATLDSVDGIVKNACSRVSSGKGAIDIDLIYRIVEQILNESGSCVSGGPRKEKDPNGFMLVHGDSVVCEKFNAGGAKADVCLKDIVNSKESPHMGAGFMEIKNSELRWVLKYEEFEYIVDGEIGITLNGRTYKGKKGDVFYIPRDSEIIWKTEGYARLFYTTYPANWAELSGNSK